MRKMRRRMQIMYSRFFISFKPPFLLRLEVDIQQLMFLIRSILLLTVIKQENKLNISFAFLISVSNYHYNCVIS